jgi:hypoxanthine phosphoribosyltransferase
MSELATVLFSAEDIRRRVAELGRIITADYRDRVPVLVSVLKGGTTFLADLFRDIHLPVKVDFMSISAYDEGSKSSGVVRIVKDLDQDVGGEDVIVVEDIIDTGLTLTYLLSTLRSRSPRSLEVCALLDKSVRRITPLDLRYVGFDCPDQFVVGYGLDYRERYRNLGSILAVQDMAALADDPDALASSFPQDRGPAEATNGQLSY